MIPLLTSAIIYSGIGLVSGFLSGLLGIGGGTITVPLLFFYLQHTGIPQENVMQCAIGTSLASMVITLLASTIHYNQKKAVLFGFVKKIIPGILIGCFAGGFLTTKIPEEMLETIFGFFLIIIALKTIVNFKNSVLEKKLPGIAGTTISGILISTTATILGIGGGVILIPYLHAFNVDHKKTVGTACAVSCIIAFISSAYFLIFGKINVAHAYTLGFIYIPAFLLISATSYISSKQGVKAAHSIKDRTAKTIFSTYIIIIAITMIL